MSSSLYSVGRLDRKFVTESSGNPNEKKLRYNDPSFVTFRVLFDFEPIVSADEVMQGLLLNESRDESAISYLRRMGEFERAEALKEFTWMLSRITNDFPWFFKSLTGIDGLWKWGHMGDDDVTTNVPVPLSVSCYETVDLRITALADLYRKATRDRRYFRELLTLDKKRFNMTVLVGEARNLRTFADAKNPNWLDHVSTIAFRCLDCQFDFSSTMPNSIDASESPVQLSPSFSIIVNRVQETNSYMLLNYMLGEIKRDLVIKQGGSGAEANQDMDIINYRSLLAPFVRSYEGNYGQVIADLNRNVTQNFLNRITFIPGDRTANLSYPDRERLNNQSLDGISKMAEMSATSAALLNASIQTANITEAQSLIDFGRPTVNEELTEPVDLRTIKIEEDVANQIEFIKPKVETELSDFSLRGPNFATYLDDNVGLTKPTVQNELVDSITLTAPTVDTDQGSGIEFKAPVVQTGLDNNIGFVAPTVQEGLDQNIQLERPTVDRDIDQAISFGRPSVATTVDNNIQFIKPTVLENISEKIAFEKPKVEDDFGS
jgi:hypothetical protein